MVNFSNLFEPVAGSLVPITPMEIADNTVVRNWNRSDSSGANIVTNEEDTHLKYLNTKHAIRKI